MEATGICFSAFIILYIKTVDGSSISSTVSNERLMNFIIAVESAFCLPQCIVPVEERNLSNIDEYDLALLPVSPPEYPSFVCCDLCSCDEDCHLQEFCCPVQNSLQQMQVEEERFHCILPQLKPYHDYYYPNAANVLMYTTCPSYFSSNDPLKRLCEHLEDYDELDVHLPVTDITTKITFRNRYCAHCNGVQDEHLEYWEPFMECKNGSFILTDTYRVITDVLATKSCNLLYNIPEKLGDFKRHCSDVISECNATMLWQEYDPLIEAACKAYKHVYRNRYRNVFCYLCNSNDTIAEEEECYSTIFPGGGGPIEFIETSFSVIIQFTKPTTVLSGPAGIMDARRCRSDQVYDSIQDLCRDIVCYPSREYRDGSCVSCIQSIGGLSYQVYILFNLEEQPRKPNGMMIAEYLKSHFTDMMLKLLTETTHFKGQVYKHVTDEVGENEIPANSFILHVDVAVTPYYTINSSAIDAILALDSDILEIKCFESIYAKYKMNLVKPATFDESLVLYQNSVNETYVEVLSFLHYGFELMVKTFTETLIPPIACPLIKLSLNQCSSENNDQMVNVGWLHLSLSKSEYLKIRFHGEVKEYIYICTSVFLHALEELSGHNTSLEIDNKLQISNIEPQYYLSLICTCLSVFCSILTIVTYAMFKELRTQPGINNMLLTCSLFGAQVSFQFGSHLAEEVPDWACKVIGILIHFLWLKSVAWMNVCSFHMFKVFSNYRTLPNHDNLLKTTLKYSCYCFVVSVLPVVANIIVSASWTHSEGIGYGGRICYISDHKMVGYTFALPVGLLITANFILFAAVLITLKRLNHIETTPKNRNFIQIYLKLSTLCGLTWAFGFLFVVTGERALEYIFIVSNASQGVFIFISFVCNRRVFVMYRNLALRQGINSPLHSPVKRTGQDITHNTRL